MSGSLESVSYECVIPVEQETTFPTPVYRSPSDESGGVIQDEASTLKQPLFLAWPEVKKFLQPLCFPTLRAVYFPLHSSNLSPEEIQKATRQYLEQHPDILDSALIEQTVTWNSIHFHAWQQLIETGKFPQ